MKTIKINVPEGYEIDVENSDLAKGIIATKKIERQLPKSWDEMKDKPGTIICHIKCYSDYIRSFNALSKLITLRDNYNGESLENWQNWDGKNHCFVVVFEYGKPIIVSRCSYSNPMALKTEELAKEFLKNFEDLLMIARPLL